MKILQITPYYPPSKGFGGPPEVAHQLSLELKNLGHEIIVLTTTIGTTIKSNTQNIFEEIPVIYHKIKPPRHWKRSKEFSLSLDRQIKNADLILIHTLFSHTTWMAIRKCKIYNKDYYLFAHGMLDSFALNKNKTFKKLYINTLLKPWFNFGIAVFNAEEEKDNSQYKEFFKEAIIIPNGISPSDFQNVDGNYFEQRNKQLKSKKVFLFLGRLDPKKGLDILIHAFSAFSKKYEDAHLLIAGPDYISYQRELEKKIDNNKSHKSITFLGPVYGAEKFELLKSSFAFVQPSYYEGLSISLLEAMASGLPIITSNQVGLHKKLNSNEAAIIIKPNEKELYNALERIYLENEFRNKISSNAKKIAFEEHSWEKIGLMVQKLAK